MSCTERERERGIYNYKNNCINKSCVFGVWSDNLVAKPKPNANTNDTENIDGAKLFVWRTMCKSTDCNFESRPQIASYSCRWDTVGPLFLEWVRLINKIRIDVMRFFWLKIIIY